MSVRFIIGRAGSGKTHHCLEAIRARLREDAVDGPRAILLVPEQAALQSERAIIEPADLRASHRAEVLSFRRLAFRVLDSAGDEGRRAISEPARTMVLRRLLAANADRLRYYRRRERTAGLVEQLGACIREFIEEHIDPAALREAAGDAKMDPLADAKMHDLALIYEAYLDYLGDDRLDPSQYLTVARQGLKRCDWLRGAEMFIDGFASFARQEILTLIELSRICARIEITMLCDPDLFTGAGSPPVGETGSLFAKTLRTHARIRSEFDRAGVAVDDPLLLHVRRAPRFAQRDTLADLERFVFDPAPVAQGERAAPVGFRIAALPSRRVEVEYAVAEVARLVRDPNAKCRYGDIAIIARDLAPYHDLLSPALHARGIPFFIDRRRTTAHHPLVELLRAALDMCVTDMSPDSVRLALKTGLCPLDEDAADELENALVASGVSGWSRWADESRPILAPAESGGRRHQSTEYDTARRQRVEQCRRAFLAGFAEWFSKARAQEKKTGREWATALLTLLKELNVGATLAEWSARAEQRGELDEAEEHRQVWRDVTSFLDDMGFALSDEPLATDDLADVLEAGLAQLSLGLTPPMLDQVLVGSIDRSRHPELKAVVLIGFNDGVFPKPAMEDAILGDDDREALRNAGAPVLAPARTRTLEEDLLVYVGVTRASEHLLITYATTDEAGKALRPSPCLAALLRACPGVEVDTVDDPAASRADWDILAPCDLSRRIAMEFRTRPALEEDNAPPCGTGLQPVETSVAPASSRCEHGLPARATLSQQGATPRAVFNELYERVRCGADAASLARAMRAFRDPSSIRLSDEPLRKSLPSPMRTSVSRLETYASCPFKYYAESMLRLVPRPEAALEAADVGTVHHAILEDFVADLSRRGVGFGELDEGEVASGLEASCGRVGAKLAAGEMVSLSRDAYLLSRSRDALHRVLLAQRTLGGVGRTRPKGTEVPFGFEDSASLPALEIRSPKGIRVIVRGYIDRVDIAELADESLCVVVDYKRARDKRLDLAGAYHGTSLQLIGYLLALADHGESLTGRPLRPIGAFYISFSTKYTTVDHPDDAIDQNFTEAPHAPRGLINADDLRVLHTDHPDHGRTGRYSVYLKKDGSLGHIDSSDAASKEQFQDILNHTRRKIGELADQIHEGDVTVRPIRLGTYSPCSWCEMRSVCRFEIGRDEVRYLDKMKRSEVFRAISTD